MSEIDKSILRKIHFLVTLAMMLFPSLPLRVSNFVMITWVALSVVLFISEGFKLDRKKIGMACVFGCLTVFYAVDLLRTYDVAAGKFILEKSSGLLAIPLAMALLPYKWNRKEIQYIFDSFTIGALILALWANIVFWMNGPAPEFAEAISSYSYRMTFSKITDVHPTYAAIFFLFGALTQIHQLIKPDFNEFRTIRIARIVIAHLLVFFALFAAARTPLIAFFVVLGILWIRTKGWKRTIVPVAITTAALIIAFIFITPLKQRYVQVVETEVALPQGDFHNSVNVRYGIFRCSLEILEENWLWGTSAGDLQNELNVCFEQFNTTVYQTGNYNTHNQYLDLWLSLGIIGLVAVFLIFWIPISNALRTGSEFYLGFILFFSICCLTENVLARQWGVEFFAFFNSVFYFRYRSQKMERTPYVQAT